AAHRRQDDAKYTEVSGDRKAIPPVRNPRSDFSGVRMTVVISLLRGVNVGGHNKIKMEVLRSLCEELGYTDPQTHVQSGNVVFKVKERERSRIAERLASAIEKNA